MWLLLVNSNDNFECDWHFELSDNELSDNELSDDELSDNNLACELVENRSFFTPVATEEIVILKL